MSSSFFDLIEQEITLLQQRQKELETENSALRQQLSDLRNGLGLIVMIEGQSFSTASPATTTIASIHTAPRVATPNEEKEQQRTSSQIVAQEPIYAATPAITAPLLLEDEETRADANSEQTTTTTPTEVPATTTKISEEPKTPQPAVPTFLEEILLDEFVAAATNPMAIWTGPVQKPEPVIDEDQKAALRRELMGSFLLE